MKFQSIVLLLLSLLAIHVAGQIETSLMATTCKVDGDCGGGSLDNQDYNYFCCARMIGVDSNGNDFDVH